MRDQYILWGWVEKLFDFLREQLQWLLDFLLWLPKRIFELLLDGLVAVLAVIPVPQWMTNLSTDFGALPAGVLFFLNAMEVPTGIGIFVSAYALRFLIRRLPWVG